MKTDAVRAEVRNLVHGPSYMTFDDVVADFPMKHINTRPPNVTYTPWHLLEHIRIAQRDILEYIQDEDYHHPSWPADWKNQPPGRLWRTACNIEWTRPVESQALADFAMAHTS